MLAKCAARAQLVSAIFMLQRNMRGSSAYCSTNNMELLNMSARYKAGKMSK
jgi:hypothetical protein